MEEFIVPPICGATHYDTKDWTLAVCINVLDAVQGKKFEEHYLQIKDEIKQETRVYCWPANAGENPVTHIQIFIRRDEEEMFDDSALYAVFSDINDLAGRMIFEYQSRCAA